MTPTRLALSAAMLGMAFQSTTTLAADHAEAPMAAADPAADLADLYAWHTTDGKLVTIVTFAGLGLPGEPAMYDTDVLYGVHLDNDGDHQADIDVWVRFGQDAWGNWGMQVTNLPGTSQPVAGSVEDVIQAPGGQVFAGLRDDPFFFDLEGYQTTLAVASKATQPNADLSFDSNRDSLAGTNVTAFTLEMDLTAALDGSDDIQIWATTSRL